VKEMAQRRHKQHSGEHAETVQTGGAKGIRTLDTVAGTPDFKSDMALPHLAESRPIRVFSRNWRAGDESFGEGSDRDVVIGGTTAAQAPTTATILAERRAFFDEEAVLEAYRAARTSRGAA
jgi:hypothetical protein